MKSYQKNIKLFGIRFKKYDKYIKSKIRTHGDKVYTISRG